MPPLDSRTAAAIACASPRSPVCEIDVEGDRAAGARRSGPRRLADRDAAGPNDGAQLAGVDPALQLSRPPRRKKAGRRPPPLAP